MSFNTVADPGFDLRGMREIGVLGIKKS